jgi:RND family efflux transporter MFP subunit
MNEGATVLEASDEDRLAAQLASLKVPRAPGADRSAVARSRPRRAAVGVISIVLASVALGAGALWGARHARAQIFPEEVELTSVNALSVGQGEASLVASGYVTARQQAIVAPKVLGRLQSLLVDEGSSVNAGQLLAELDTTGMNARLAEIRADVATAKARVEMARADLSDANARLTRELDLDRRSAGVPAELENARLKTESLRAKLKAAESEVSATEVRQGAVLVELQNARIRAPFSGTVVHKLAQVGEMVAPQGAGILRLVALDDLEVWAEVSELKMAEVKVGAPVEVRLDAFPDKGFRGRVSEFRRQVDRAKATVTFKIEFIDPATDVLPDMAARVSFLERPLNEGDLTAAPRLVTHKDAIAQRAGRQVVFAVRDERAAEVPVEIAPGELSGGLLELRKGPPAGTRVVRHPSAGLRNGSLIKEVSR